MAVSWAGRRCRTPRGRKETSSGASPMPFRPRIYVGICDQIQPLPTIVGSPALAAPGNKPGHGAQEVGPTRGPGGGGPRLTVLRYPQGVGVGSRQGRSRRTMSPRTRARISPFQLSATAEAKRVMDSHDSDGEDERAASAPSKGPEAPHRTKRPPRAQTQMRICERARTHKHARAHTHTHTHTQELSCKHQTLTGWR